MASKKSIAGLIATIKSIYPYYAKDNNIQVLARTWGVLLNDYDDKEVSTALGLCMQECEMPPTPAHIIKKIEDMRPKATDTELWGKLLYALRKVNGLQERFEYTFRDESGVSQGDKARQEARAVYFSMPLELQRYVGSYGEMLRMSEDLDSKTLEFRKTHFLKSIPEIKETNQLQLSATKSVNLLDGK